MEVHPALSCSALQRSSEHQPLPLPGQQRRLRVGGDSSHRPLQQQDVAARSRRLPQLHPQVPGSIQSVSRRRNGGEAAAAALTFLFVGFACSAVEQPGVVFSVEQTRCGLLPKTEPLSPERAAEDSGISDTCESDGEEERGSPGKLFLKLKEKPEELLQLEAGDAVVPLSGGEAAGKTPPPGGSSFVFEPVLKHISSLPPSGPVELSFASPPAPNAVPGHPKDLCSPQLRQLLSPIFDGLNPSSSPSSSSEPDLVREPFVYGL